MTRNIQQEPCDITFDRTSGKLYRIHSRFVEVAIAWPRPECWRETLGSQRPHIMRHPVLASQQIVWDLHGSYGDSVTASEGLLLYSLGQVRALRDFERTIPVEVREQLGRFGIRQWHVLELLARGGSAALDLCRSNAALGYALASCWVFRPTAIDDNAGTQLKLLAHGVGQRAMLRTLGFPDDRSSRRMLAKVEPRGLRISHLLRLRRALADREMRKAMQHLPTLNRHAIRVATTRKLLDFATPELLLELSYSESSFLSESQGVIEAVSWMTRADSSVRPRKLQSVQECVDLSAQIRGNDGGLHRGSADGDDAAQVFPEPPFPGNLFIQPIETVEGLALEGRSLSHCAANYTESVTAGHTYLYRVLDPERATLSIQHDGNGDWSLEQALGESNAELAEETMTAIQQWLDENGAGKRPRPDWALGGWASVRDTPFISVGMGTKFISVHPSCVPVVAAGADAAQLPESDRIRVGLVVPDLLMDAVRTFGWPAWMTLIAVSDCAFDDICRDVPLDPDTRRTIDLRQLLGFADLKDLGLFGNDVLFVLAPTQLDPGTIELLRTIGSDKPVVVVQPPFALDRLNSYAWRRPDIEAAAGVDTSTFPSSPCILLTSAWVPAHWETEDIGSASLIDIYSAMVRALSGFSLPWHQQGTPCVDFSDYAYLGLFDSGITHLLQLQTETSADSCRRDHDRLLPLMPIDMQPGFANYSFVPVEILIGTPDVDDASDWDPVASALFGAFEGGCFGDLTMIGHWRHEDCA